MSDPDISGEEYQNGQTVGFANVKAFVRFRDKNKCRQCNGKSKDKHIEVHHIQHKEDGGSDRPDNLVCLCHTCHRQYHDGKLKLKKFQLNRANAKTLRDAAAMNIIKDRVLQCVREKYPDKEVKTTYGYITRWNRKKYNIDKTHANDAYVIAGNFSAKQLDYYFKGFQVRRHNRQIYKDTIQKGGEPKNNQAEHLVFGFALNDRVIFNGIECFVHGRRSKGYFDLKDIDGNTIHNSAPVKKVKLISHENSIMLKRISKSRKAGADSFSDAKDVAISSARLFKLV
jgi:N6-L-threonylcarbamoyladenine synthase